MNSFQSTKSSFNYAQLNQDGLWEKQEVSNQHKVRKYISENGQLVLTDLEFEIDLSEIHRRGIRDEVFLVVTYETDSGGRCYRWADHCLFSGARVR